MEDITTEHQHHLAKIQNKISALGASEIDKQIENDPKPPWGGMLKRRKKELRELRQLPDEIRNKEIEKRLLKLKVIQAELDALQGEQPLDKTERSTHKTIKEQSVESSDEFSNPLEERLHGILGGLPDHWKETLKDYTPNKPHKEVVEKNKFGYESDKDLVDPYLNGTLELQLDDEILPFKKWVESHEPVPRYDTSFVSEITVSDRQNLTKLKMISTSEVGSGATAIIHLYQDEAGNKYAIKLPKPGSDQNDKNKSLRETAILNRVQKSETPYTPSVKWGKFEVNGKPQFCPVLEYIPEKGELVRIKENDPSKLPLMASQYAALMSELHSLNISTFGDRKGNDIRWNESSNSLKVLDWNRAKVVPKKERKARRTQDIAVFGSLFLQIAVNTNHGIGLVENHQQELEISQGKSIPPAFIRVLEKCLSQGYQNFQEIITDLDKVDSGHDPIGDNEHQMILTTLLAKEVNQKKYLPDTGHNSTFDKVFREISFHNPEAITEEALSNINDQQIREAVERTVKFASHLNKQLVDQKISSDDYTALVKAFWAIETSDHRDKYLKEKAKSIGLGEQNMESLLSETKQHDLDVLNSYLQSKQ